MSTATQSPPVTTAPAARPVAAFAAVLSRHRDLLVMTTLMVVCAVVHGVNMHHAPGFINDDEGTYVAQAWAVQMGRGLTHYTYWYDHPPLGWIQIAAWTWLTDAFEHVQTSVMAGREAMLLAKVASVTLLYHLARRIGLGLWAAGAAVLLFAVTPLAVHYQRMVFLDNVAVPWVLAAFVLAASPRRRLAAVAGSGVCFAVAVLSKETVAVLLPGLLWQLWQHSDRRTRGYAWPIFWVCTGGVTALWVLYAIVKNELLPGPGHVSMLWAFKWQLFERPTSGSLLDPGSGTRGLVNSWLDMDVWLPAMALAAMPVALAVRRLRPVAATLAIQLLMLLRDGYLPYPYPIAMLPFAALVIAGGGDAVWNAAHRLPWRRPLRLAGGWAVRGALVAAVALVGVQGGPAWARTLHAYATTTHSTPTLQALAWIDANVPRDQRVVVDDNIWVDMTRLGFDPDELEVIWFYKIDLDPAVQERLPNGYRDLDYVVLGSLAESTLNDLPTVRQAIEHSTEVASFGDGTITVRRVDR